MGMKMTRRDLSKLGLTALGGVGFVGRADAVKKDVGDKVSVGCGRDACGGVGRWPVEKANDWYKGVPWPIGCNYVTSTAVNQLEMWQAETFDPKTIDVEFALAEGLGFNTMRVFLHDLAWKQDPDGSKKRVSDFLAICKKHRMRALMTFFTNGGPGTKIAIGKQPEPLPGVHNSRWLQSPGREVVNFPEKWGYLEEYVKDVLTTFANDDRVLLWCLYNEPESHRNGNRSLPLLRRLFEWARSVNPQQPLTAPVFFYPMHPRTDFPICCFLGENCDVMSFHCYQSPSMVEKMITLFQTFGRPVLCTEYLSRPANTFENVLPLLHKNRVGAINFGLVNGKCNFQFYGNDLPEPKFWKHDIFRKDGTPFDPRELDVIRSYTAVGKK
jgi:hypothetical protein